MDKQTYFLAPCPSTLGQYLPQDRVLKLFKNTKKLNSQFILNNGLFMAHIKLELGMLGVAQKLVKDVA